MTMRTSSLLVWIVGLSVLYSAQPGEAQCSSGWEQNGGRCYWYSGTAMYRAEAATTCQEMSSQLVTVDSADVQSYLMSRNLDYFVWLGLYIVNDPQNGSYWRWSNGETNNYQSWGTPPTSPIACSHFVPPFGIWVNYNECNYEHEYICKKQRVNNQCDSGWVHFGGYCYFRQTIKRTNMAASSDCMARGGSLASIHSEEEKHFFESIAGTDSTWIGLYPLRWDGGTTFHYQNFDNEGPLIPEPCVIMTSSGLWSSEACATTPRRFVCSRGLFGRADDKTEEEKQNTNDKVEVTKEDADSTEEHQAVAETSVQSEDGACSTKCPCAKSYLTETCDLDIESLCPAGYADGLRRTARKIPDPQNCRKYHVCVKGFPIGNCPKGTVFDPTTQKCTFDKTCSEN